MITELMNTYKNIRKESIKRRNFKFGEEWEEEVRDLFFTNEYYDILEKTHNYKQNKKDFVQSTLNPDYKFLCKATNQEFYIECKARNITKVLRKIRNYETKYDKLINEGEKILKDFTEKNKYLELIEICPEKQFYRYKELNNHAKVLFMILLTSDDDTLDDLFILLPIDDLITNKIFLSDLFSFKIFDEEVAPYILWRNFLLFYGLPGYCISCNTRIKFNNLNPFCFECWEKWFKLKQFTHQEKYCHACGKEFKTASIKPLCIDCYKKFPINYPL